MLFIHAFKGSDAMTIINNLPGSNNHYQQMVSLAQNADTLYLVSPFLMRSFDDLIYEFKEAGVQHIHLVTKLIDNDPDLLKKADALDSFCGLCNDNEIQYSVYVDNKLHGKIYIASKNGIYTGGVLSSANFTDRGLKDNHEWGFWLGDPDVLKNLRDQVFSVCRQIDNDRIESIIRKVDEFAETRPAPQVEKMDLRISDLFGFGAADSEEADDSDIRYFFKPNGSQQRPFPTTEKLDANIATLRFAKRRPRAVRVGDILICYGVGTTKLLGYFRVTDPPELTGSDDDRWPWTVQAQNLCPAYSENWTQFGNTVSSVRNAFGLNNIVTNKGGKTLGALMRGSDKLQLTPQFAKHIIRIIERQVAEPAHGFAGFRRFFETLQDDQITLSFDRIEELIGEPLCASARKHHTYWHPSPTHTICRAWMDNGYRTAGVSLANEEITFKKSD
jgi:hypothetical protein